MPISVAEISDIHGWIMAASCRTNLFAKTKKRKYFVATGELLGHFGEAVPESVNDEFKAVGDFKL